MLFKVVLTFFVSVSFIFGANYDELLQNKNIKIGVSPNMPPFSKSTSNGFAGFEVEFAKALTSKVFPNGMNITFIGIEQSDRLNAVKNKEVDILIAAYTINDERAEQIDFSAPYFSIILSLVSKKSSNIKSKTDLMGKTIATIKNSNSDDWLKKNGINIVYCKNNMECYQKVKNDEAIGFMHNIVSTATIPLIDNNFEISIKFSDLAYMDCVATQKDSSKLLEKINSAIVELSKEGFFKKNYNDTFATFYKGMLDQKYFILDDLYSILFNI